MQVTPDRHLSPVQTKKNDDDDVEIIKSSKQKK